MTDSNPMTNSPGKHRRINVKDLFFYGFLIAYGGILIFLAHKLNIWEDESYSLHTSSHDLMTVISQSYKFEAQPPFYFLLLSMWRTINSGVFFTRLLSLLFIGFSAVYFYRLVRLIFGFEHSRWMLIIFLLNPFTVWAGLEIRLYSLMMFLSVTSMYYFFRFYIEDKNKYLYIFLLISLIGLYTQYFFIFEISALGLSLLIFRGWKVFFKFCLYLIPVGILCAPSMFFVSQQIATARSNLVYTTLSRISIVLHSPQELMLALTEQQFVFGIRTSVKIIFIFLIVWGYLKLYKKQPKTNDAYFTRINIIILTIVVVLSFYSAIFAITGGYQVRYLTILFPILILLFTIFKAYGPAISNFIYAIVSVYYISLLIAQYSHPMKRYDFESAAKFLEKIENDREPILLYSKILLPPFVYYYTGPNPLISLPAFKYDNRYYEDNISDTLELKKAIEKINSPTKSYLFMTNDVEGFKNPINMNEQMIDEFLHKNYKITLDTFVLGENKKYTLKIRRLEIKNK